MAMMRDRDDLATKADIRSLQSETAALRADIAEVRAEIAGLRGEFHSYARTFIATQAATVVGMTGIVLAVTRLA
jgi:hypothetical protein